MIRPTPASTDARHSPKTMSSASAKITKDPTAINTIGVSSVARLVSCDPRTLRCTNSAAPATASGTSTTCVVSRMPRSRAITVSISSTAATAPMMAA